MYTTETFQLTQGLPALAPLQSGPTTVGHTLQRCCPQAWQQHPPATLLRNLLPWDLQH